MPKKRSARNLWSVRFLEIFGPPRSSKTQQVEYGWCLPRRSAPVTSRELLQRVTLSGTFFLGKRLQCCSMWFKFEKKKRKTLLTEPVCLASVLHSFFPLFFHSVRPAHSSHLLLSSSLKENRLSAEHKEGAKTLPTGARLDGCARPRKPSRGATVEFRGRFSLTLKF